MKLFASLVFLLAAPWFQNPAFAQVSENTAKAVFVERFTRFVDWPEASRIADTSQPFVIAVIGDDPLRSTLEQVFAQRNVRNKHVLIRHVSRLAEIAGSHVLFISRSQEHALSDILAFTTDKPVLTVSDTPGFAERGVHINFYLVDDKLRFEVNEAAIEVSALSMSYLLLRVARIVHPAGG